MKMIDIYVNVLNKAKKIFNYNLDIGSPLFGNHVYKIKNINQKEFIGSFKTWSGHGQFSIPCKFTKVDKNYFIDDQEYNNYKDLDNYVVDFEIDTSKFIKNISIIKKFELSLLNILFCDYYHLDYIKIRYNKRSDIYNFCNFCKSESDFYFIYTRDDEYNTDDDEDSSEDIPYIGAYKWQFRSDICINCLEKLQDDIYYDNLEIHGIFPKNLPPIDTLLIDFIINKKNKYIWNYEKKNRYCYKCANHVFKFYIFYQLLDSPSIFYSGVCRSCLKSLLSKNYFSYIIIYPANWKWFGRF